MTYRELIAELRLLNDEQLDCDVVVEDSAEDECYEAELTICGDEHSSLEPDYPVILF
jgi:hypothetical protein